MLKTQELENARQATVISRLEETLISSDRKCKPDVLEDKPEVLEAGKNITVRSSPFIILYIQPRYKLHFQIKVRMLQ